MSAKFCQNCKKTYTDPAATFCEECGADLTPLERETPVHDIADDFDEPEPVPVWKRYLPYGIGLLVVVGLAAYIPGYIGDELSKISVSIDTTRTLDALKQSKTVIPLIVDNGGSFDVNLEKVEFKASVLGVALSSGLESCAIKPVKLASGKKTQLDLPLCISKDDLDGKLKDLGGKYATSTLDVTATVKVFGVTREIALDKSTLFPDKDVKKVFDLAEERPKAADGPEGKKQGDKPKTRSSERQKSDEPKDDLRPTNKDKSIKNLEGLKDKIAVDPKTQEQIEKQLKDKLSGKK